MPTDDRFFFGYDGEEREFYIYDTAIEDELPERFRSSEDVEKAVAALNRATR